MFLCYLSFYFVIILILCIMLFTFYKIFNLIYYNFFVEEFTNILVLLDLTMRDIKVLGFLFLLLYFFVFFCYALIGLNNLF